ncbi:aldo/keto reductase [Streptococcus hillyeri]|uniref:Aldo/keto reductase n=1 Tax=Streptococcus hillyeri TaxID=2282420 RepID=A0A3L9DQ51_9STRE|nr:aldo/keto reductase [Streptococcus hillyeri]RLY03596.1 aldo/keto reductase [Streptococcus hillyeri]
MKYRPLGTTDMSISSVSFGTWALGGDWGDVTEENAKSALNHAIDRGVNFFDTADVYGGGRSEKIIGQVLKERSERVYVATKFGRRDDFTNPENYTYEKVRQYAEESLRNLQMDAIDLYQIHCPTTEILTQSDVFTVLEDLKKEGLIRYYGVSVETDDQGKFVLENTNASSLQVIVNLLRQKPVKEMIALAKDKHVGVLARVPLASGLLTGKYSKNSTFPENDHRHYNRDGAAFNVGETFGGLPFDKAIELVDQVQWIGKEHGGLATASLKWLLQQEGITAVIPGFKSIKQVDNNLESLEALPFSPQELERLSDFYWKEVHSHIRGAY